MLDEVTASKIRLVSTQEEAWSELYVDGQDRDSITTDTLGTLESEAHRSTIEGLQALAKFIDAGPAG